MQHVARRKSKAEFFSQVLMDQFGTKAHARTLQALLEWPDIYTGYHGAKDVSSYLPESL